MTSGPSAEFLALQAALKGRYSLEREIGRGGMGIVYLAQEVRLDRPVALKVLPPEYAPQPRLRERFLQEARTAANLSHPNIVPIHAVDEVDDFVFFAMAYVEGPTLGERVRERGPVPPREAARILREVSWALAYAHAQGVVHRDVKPDNILLEAGSDRTLVTDFGIAQLTEGAGLTGATEVLGTAEFMSPEQASGDPVDERSDLYSLGVVAYYMLSGRLPFEADTVAATLAKQITQPAPDLAAVASAVPGELCEVVDRCLAKDPGERYGGAEELAEAVGDALDERRDLPVALRAFLHQNRESLRGTWASGLSAFGFVVLTVVALVFGNLVAALVCAGIAALMGAAPAGILYRMARGLLRSGYGREEVVRALRHDLERRKEELAFELSARTSWIDRLAVGLTYGGLALAGIGTAALTLLDLSFGGTVTAGILVGVGGAASLGGAPWAASRARQPRKPWGERWLRFWESRPGRWLFGLAGVGLDRLPRAGASYGPTEMAIGMAAQQLFGELPDDLRDVFGDLPEVVDGLEEHAARMRERRRELTEVLHDIEGDERAGARADASGASGVVEKRASLAEEVREVREAAEERLAEVVAALETIRLELLRLHAGSGSVESMTADLGAARELSEDLARVLEGKREVDEMLGIGSPAEVEARSTPV